MRAYLESIGFAGRDGCGADGLKHDLAPVLSYLDKTHITALENPITLSVIIDLRRPVQTQMSQEASGRQTVCSPPGSSISIRQGPFPRRSGTSTDISGRSRFRIYERAQFTLQFQKSIDNNTTTITVWGPRLTSTVHSTAQKPILGYTFEIWYALITRNC